MPRKSASAVETMSTRESGSSTQSTGNLVDAHAHSLGAHEQLGVEEPASILDERQQLPRSIRADRLESALRIGEPRSENGVKQDVVAA